MDGKLEGKTIYEQSAAAIVQHNGVTKSGKLYMIARGDIDSHRSSNTANEGSIISQRGHILNDAGLMKFDEFGYVKAKTDVIAECQSQSIVTHHAHHQQAIPSGRAGILVPQR